VSSLIRPIAFYLPQFHPVKENDEWWGKGFTEWTNVSKAKPLFPGHYQPHLPADLGFYDLRVPETREEQAKLAKAHGIYGFCYYHYWFNGRRILERPFQEVLDSGKPDFPFMLCWANENWTRIWDGGENQILLEQKYSEQDDINHIRSLIPAFRDPRYIKVEGRPVFAIYRSSRIPSVETTIRTWRNELQKEGIDIYICRVESFSESGPEYMKAGFDAAIEFQPFSEKLYDYLGKAWRKKMKTMDPLKKLLRKFKSGVEKENESKAFWSMPEYDTYVEYLTQSPLTTGYNLYPGITPMWDNTARRKENVFLFKNNGPAAYEKWLQYLTLNFKPYSKEENFIFINAWNEWAEGNHLEPCAKWGRSYLEITRKVLMYE
jgi:lipopolysaccharide biosynthesis protein